MKLIAYCHYCCQLDQIFGIYFWEDKKTMYNLLDYTYEIRENMVTERNNFEKS